MYTDDLKSKIPHTEEGHTYRETTEICKHMHTHTHEKERIKVCFPDGGVGSGEKYIEGQKAAPI